MATQSVTITEYNGPSNTEFNGVEKIKWVWVSSTGGVVAASTSAGLNPTTEHYYSGEIARLVTDPSSTAPSDNYDVTILDSDGYDVLMGGGMNRHTSTTQQVLSTSLGICQYTPLSLRIADAGSNKGGTVILYIK
jgi:hypothetical protein